MPLEAATKISELNPLWPLGTDPKAEGDNHIRMLKEVLQKTDGGALTNIVQTPVTSSGTWTKPAGLQYLLVAVQAGGGGGGGAGVTGAGQVSVGGGGGGGGYGRKLYAAADLAATVAMTVGAGGSAGLGPGTPGGAGGLTTFGGLLSVSGGGGQAGTAPAAIGITVSARGAGGAVTVGSPDFSKAGKYGDQGLCWGSGTLMRGGCGGDSFCGNGGFESNSAISGTGVGPSGNNGGGGSGAMNGPSQAGQLGGVGGAGLILLTEFF